MQVCWSRSCSEALVPKGRPLERLASLVPPAAVPSGSPRVLSLQERDLQSLAVEGRWFQEQQRHRWLGVENTGWGAPRDGGSQPEGEGSVGAGVA